MDFMMRELRKDYGRRLRGCAAALAVACLIGFSMVGTALAAEPDGFGKAKFKMTAAQAKAAIPELEETEEHLGAAVVGGPRVKRFVLRKYKVPGVEHPTDVELRFWDDKLWVVIVYFGQNDYASVSKALEKQLGPTSRGDDKSRVWLGEKTTSTVSDREKYYSFADNDLSNVARAALFQGIHHAGALEAEPTKGEATKSDAASTPAASK
jgi:hypothetical protein